MPLKRDQAANQYATEAFRRLDALPKGKTSTVSARLPVKEVEALREHFEQDGRTLASGIVMLIRRYMKDEGIS